MLPQPLKYQNKVESAMARSLRSNIAPQGGSVYGLNDTITINIPTRNNLVLVPQESYLKFDHQITNTSGSNATYRWDACGAHGVIQSIKVFHGSNQLEFIDNYGNFAKMLYDLQMPSDAVYNKLNITSGTRSDLVVALAPGQTINSGTIDGTYTTDERDVLASLRDAINNVSLSALQKNSGDIIGVGVANNASTVSFQELIV